jgi:hypothetical protein
MNIRDNIKTLKIREHLKYRLEAWLTLNENYYQAENKQITGATALNAIGDCYPEELQHTEKYLRQTFGTNE